MPLPEFNDDGDLPPGVHQDTLKEVLERFGYGTRQREIIGERLRRLYELACATGHLARFAVFGSFVTAKPTPNDVDVILLMEDDFDVTLAGEPSALLFRHLEAETRFGASIFWVRRSGALGGEQAMLEHWQLRRDGIRRGIVEIVRESR